MPALAKASCSNVKLWAQHRIDPLRYSPGMVSLLRALLIWMLVLAVPVQAAAAASMALCGTGHHGAAAAVQAPAMHHADRQAASADHSHLAPDHHAAAAGDDRSQPTPAEGHKCSVCASCCSVSAISQMTLTVPEPAVVATVCCAVITTVDPFAADGPDRPPRPVLA